MTNELKPKILLVTTKADLAADSVVLKLSNYGANFYRINTEDIPLSVTSTFQINSSYEEEWYWNTRSGKVVRLSDVDCVWFRRHRLPMMPAEMSEAHAEYCLRESDWFLKGLLYSRDRQKKAIAWMSHPLNIQQAESKIYQLSLAKSLGLNVPDTLISNDPRVVRDFFHQKRGNIIAKPLRLGYFDYGDRQTSVYTSRVNLEDLANDDAIRVAPVIYQELLPKLYDLRVTIVGSQIYVAAIDSQSNPTAMIDWRRADADNLSHMIHALPLDIEKSCFELMSALGLKFGALDFVLSPEGTYTFLEINPNGQWLWLEDKLQLPISDAIANWLFANSDINSNRITDFG
jgi:glutathione synthase/RimK-type ligase-like ATP-grasp enzyme